MGCSSKSSIEIYLKFLPYFVTGDEEYEEEDTTETAKVTEPSKPGTALIDITHTCTSGKLVIYKWKGSDARVKYQRSTSGTSMAN